MTSENGEMDWYDDLEHSVHEVLDFCKTENIPYDRDDLVNSFVETIQECDSDDDHVTLVEQCVQSYHEIYEKPYSLSTEQITVLQKKITALKNIYQPPQKSEEWYQFRHNMITASSAWKILKSPATLNSYIYEKCCPYVSHSGQSSGQNSLQWGIQFEPISLELYQRRNKTKVAEFGCIPHPIYPFLGASPDGINVDVSSPLFGTMVEVKNIVNRQITGVPKQEYWIQMQLQMEVCDLDICDFLETRFKELSEEEFYQKVEPTVKIIDSDSSQEFVPLTVGILITGKSTDDSLLHRFYIVESSSKQTIEQWIQTTKIEFSIIDNILHWYLDEYSCISIKRDNEWFQSNIGKIRDAWETIIKEKTTGYEHRKPKKREQGPCKNLFTEDELMEHKNKIKVIKLE